MPTVSKNDRDPRPVADKEGVSLVFLEPNLEGVLLRLHPGREGRTPSKEDARRRLPRLWPGRQEPVSADDLEKRFDGGDLRRLARRDQHMDRLIEILGLPRAP